MQSNPAMNALHKAVNHAIANGSPVFVNQPIKTFTTFADERLVYLHRIRRGYFYLPSASLMRFLTSRTIQLSRLVQYHTTT